jgi:Ca2+-transporting ATPase
MDYKNIPTDYEYVGMTPEAVEESRKTHGYNVLTPAKKTPMWKLYIEKFRDPIIEILLVAALISLVLAFVEKDFIETIGIFVAIFLATTVGFIFERDAARKFDMLNALGEEQPVKVRRNGEVMQIARKDIVVGDVVLVEVGDEIPADGRLLSSTDLQINESSLTGEQITNKFVDESKGRKDATYPVNLVLRSSMVMNGRGVFVVTAIGDETEIGRVARKSTEDTNTQTPLNIQLERLAKLISKIGTAVAIGAFIIFLVHDILVNPLWHTSNYFGMLQIVLNYFMMAVTIIVMAVPEGLPMAVTLALALNMRRMLKSNNLVRHLHASETMGAVTVICTDKTGTLTQNKMQVEEMNVFAGSESLLADAISLNTTAELGRDEKGNATAIGNPTESALLLWLADKNIDYKTIRQKYAVEDYLPFSTERKYMITIARVEDKRYLFIKGAPEIVAAKCSVYNVDYKHCFELLSSWQSRAMRTLVFAYAEIGEQYVDLKGDKFEFPLTLQAIAAIADPIRQDVPQAVEQCLNAGIKVKIVTGDTRATAIEIAKEIGIWNEDGFTENEIKLWHITGPDFEALSDDEALKCVKTLKVMSRARPTDKQRLVTMLQKQDEVVAVTGDGTNDAPALHYAQVGLSLGSGTNVAKEASDMTLVDDSFGSIAKAVMWGRSLYKNIQRFLFFQLVVNLTALLLVLGGSIVGTEMPLTVTQILWVNLIMDTFAAMALASLPPSREVMRAKPRSSSAFIISRPMLNGILFCGITFFIVMMAFLIYCERGGTRGVDVHELTLFFTTFVMLQMWNLFNAKSFGSVHSAFRYLWRDTWFLAVLAITIFGQWLIVTFGGKMFRTSPMTTEEWLIIIGATSVVLWAGEIYRLWRRKRI